MKILAVDPGNKKSAWVVFDDNDKLYDFGLTDNEILLEWILSQRFDVTRLIAEVIKSYGNVMGDTLLETCVWIGRFQQAFGPEEFTGIARKTIVSHVCGNPRANDSNVRRAMIDRFPRTGGGKEPSIGTKASPGPLYGVSKDVWSALAVAVTYFEIYEFLS